MINASNSKYQCRVRRGFAAAPLFCALALTFVINFGRAQSEVLAPPVVQARPDSVMQFDARAASIHGRTARFEMLGGLGNICYWTDPTDWISWGVPAGRGGDFVVELNYSCAAGADGTSFEVALGESKLTNQVVSTGTWDDHRIVRLGTLAASQSGPQTLSVKPLKQPGGAVMNLAWLRLIPTANYTNYLAHTATEHDPSAVLLPKQVFVVPNFHPASCGWLANWSVERNYCANSYMAHLDRVRDDTNYCFALSECNNLLAIKNFWPERFDELKQRITEKRVELVNAFFLEPTINLSGGEALAKMGIEGLRWQQQVMGTRPRFCWAIDVCGVHQQMPQLCEQLGLDALVYIRCNRTDKNAFWSESPDGTRILTLVPDNYANELGGAYQARLRLTPVQLHATAKEISTDFSATPFGAPLLILAGHGDYSLPPPRRENPTEFLQQWKEFQPDCELRISGLSAYADTLLAGIKSGAVELPTLCGGTAYTFESFWIQGDRVKTWYRRDEHALQAAETLATIASLKSDYEYPVQPLYCAWLQMLLNMDRNTLWGAAAGMVFEDEKSWDASDRFRWVEQHSRDTLAAAAKKIAGAGEAITLFNPANWDRTDPARLKLPEGSGLKGAVCETTADGSVLCQPNVPSLALTEAVLDQHAPNATKSIAMPPTIETKFYSARFDASSGVLVSLKLKPSGREMLGGPANEIVVSKNENGTPSDFTAASPSRPFLGRSSQSKSTLTAMDGPLTITVQADSELLGQPLRRVVRFFKNHPRIEFETDMQDIVNHGVVVSEFPLAAEPKEIRRGIPFGFSRDDGWLQGIAPAVRWSDYSTPGAGGVALLDRGLSGREIVGTKPMIYLFNAAEKYWGYPNSWLDGKGPHHFEYALVAHEADWTTAQISRLAWEYNCPLVLNAGCATVKPQSFATTSDNVIVEVIRRDVADIEMRLVETLGLAGQATVTLNLPHTSATMTDLLGGRAKPLAGGPTYKFPVRSQQILTLRFRTEKPVAETKPLTQWDELVPEQKLPALRKHIENVKGHPPRGF